MDNKKKESMPKERPFDTKLANGIAPLVQLAIDHEPQFARRRFGPDKTRALQVLLGAFQAEHDGYYAERAQAAQLRLVVESILKDAIGYRSEISLAMSLLGREGIPALPSIRKRSSLAESASRYLAWMNESRPVIASLADVLSTCMERPLPRLDELYSKLAAGVSAHRRALADVLPARRASLARTRAELEHFAWLLRLAGRLAFKGQPEMLKRLRVNNRKGKHRTQRSNAVIELVTESPKPASAA
jgi:hypothetical protein